MTRDLDEIETHMNTNERFVRSRYQHTKEHGIVHGTSRIDEEGGS